MPPFLTIPDELAEAVRLDGRAVAFFYMDRDPVSRANLGLQ